MKVLVVGANGYFGSIMVDELLTYSACDVVLAGRDIEALETTRQVNAQHSARTSVRKVVLDQADSIADALQGINIAICAAGPYQGLGHLLLESSIDRGIHYIDIADDRQFVLAALKIASDRQLKSVVCTGWSTVPALSAVLVELCKEKLNIVREIQIQIAPGNRSPRAPGTVASLLSSLDRPFAVLQGGTWTRVSGWSARRDFEFPQPVGRRPGYLVDAPDVSIFPQLFGASTVEFRAGAEVDLFNRGLTALTWLSAVGAVKSWRPHQPFLQFGMSLFGWLGTDTGAVGVAVHGVRACKETIMRASIVADSVGQNIPVLPAVVMVSHLVAGQGPQSGIIPYNQWLTGKQLADECRRRDYRLILEDNIS